MMKKIITLLFSMLLFFGAVPAIAAACSGDDGEEDKEDGPKWYTEEKPWPLKWETKDARKTIGPGSGKGQGGNGGCDDGASVDKGKGGKGGRG